MFSVGQTVRIAAIKHPPFPSKVGKIGTVQKIETPKHEHDQTLYIIKLSGGKGTYGCYDYEIEAAE